MLNLVVVVETWDLALPGDFGLPDTYKIIHNFVPFYVYVYDFLLSHFLFIYFPLSATFTMIIVLHSLKSVNLVKYLS